MSFIRGKIETDREVVTSEIISGKLPDNIRKCLCGCKRYYDTRTGEPLRETTFGEMFKELGLDKCNIKEQPTVSQQYLYSPDLEARIKKIKIDIDDLITVLEAMKESAGTESVVIIEHEGLPALADANDMDNIIMFQAVGDEQNTDEDMVH